MSVCVCVCARVCMCVCTFVCRFLASSEGGLGEESLSASSMSVLSPSFGEATDGSFAHQVQPHKCIIYTHARAGSQALLRVCEWCVKALVTSTHQLVPSCCCVLPPGPPRRRRPFPRLSSSFLFPCLPLPALLRLHRRCDALPLFYRTSLSSLPAS